MYPAQIFLSFVFGSLIGSFLNVVMWRLPREEKLTGRSHCANCRHPLTALELFPFFSFLFLKGRCRYCGRRISGRYPFFEALTGALFIFVFLFYKPGDVFTWLLTVKGLLAVSLLLAIFVIDLEHYLILDNMVLFGAISCFILNLALDITAKNNIASWHSLALRGAVSALLATVPFYGLWYFSEGKWMGFGDVKLMLFLGQMLGWPIIWAGLFISVITGGIAGVFLIIFWGRNLKSKVPFGVFLSLGAFFALFWGRALLDWYLSVLKV